MGIWTPAIPRPPQLAALIRSARQQTRGRVDVLLLDIDGSMLESGGGFAAGVDYILALVDPTENGQLAADHLAERLSDAPPPQGQIAVVFCRANETEAEQFPQQTVDRRLPIAGYFPADYLLAGDDASQRGGHPVVPHEGYLQAVAGLSRMVRRLARLRRITPAD
jgi:CO dehydrogenase nickel-insertion accessory protein CooC1